ncbi:MAG: methionyl-tRNA formyltransferase [Gammaproteobacteria bacterium]|nr:methionyl-tRNA formyltransferase [Gammaproteobacteria bacterium]
MKENLPLKTPSSPLRVIFAGTPKFAIPTLRALSESPSTIVVTVYTQPDRGAGRGRGARMSAVKQFALENNVNIEQPLSWRDPEVLDKFANYAPDLLVVAAYGLILPAQALDLPTLGAINVHASILPRWRGAAPIQRALIAGDAETGITIMRVVPELDAGPMLLTKNITVTDQDTCGTVEQSLAELGACATLETITLLVNGRTNPVIQDPSKVTYAAKLTREERQIDWTLPAADLVRRIRAFNPEPLVICEILGIPMNVLRATAVDSNSCAQPGTVIAFAPQGIDIATAQGALRLLQIQPQGKRSMSVRDFVNGYRQKINRGDP